MDTILDNRNLSFGIHESVENDFSKILKLDRIFDCDDCVRNSMFLRADGLC